VGYPPDYTDASRVTSVSFAFQVWQISEMWQDVYDRVLAHLGPFPEPTTFVDRRGTAPPEARRKAAAAADYWLREQSGVTADEWRAFTRSRRSGAGALARGGPRH
jgi:hypothetical protein